MCQPCVQCFPTSYKPMRALYNILNSSPHSITCNGLNRNADVGSFFNIYTNNLVINSTTENDKLVRKQVQGSVFCQLIKVEHQGRNNLLKAIGIDDELRLNIALNMTTVNHEIFKLYSYEPSVDSIIRLIDYHRIDQEVNLPDDIHLVRKILPNLPQDEDFTHVITGVKRGIDFVLVLELTKNDNQHEIDLILEKLTDYFKNSKDEFLSTEDQLKIIDLRSTVFTSITDIHSLTANKDFNIVCQHIYEYINENKVNSTLSYVLHPLQCIFYEKLFNLINYSRLDFTLESTIEEELFRLSRQLNNLQHIFDEKIQSQSIPSLEDATKMIYEKMHELNNNYNENRQILAMKINQFRRNQLDLRSLQKVFDDLNFKNLRLELKNLQTSIVTFGNKLSCIKKLQIDYQMKYLNVATLEKSNDNEETLKSKLFYLDQQHTTYYLISTSKFVENNPDQFRKSYEELTTKLCQPITSLNIVFADFFYCNSKPKSMEILQAKCPVSSTRSTVNTQEINILLVGESGVGKSTFINAFVNYLAFSSLQQAVKEKPIVLIPVSFFITIGHHFEEKLIEFGQFDTNENFNQTGQSVTQYCKSYIFTIEKNIKLRIIDTPGFGDTRGVKQDDKNIDHILSYINSLPYLNAICFLLKPNTTRLHILFRSCFMQLMNFLGPNAHKNIIFCFTNTRATFYAPGETTKLLKSILNELPCDNRPPFVKQNTFCFDSEAFRYLAIIQNGHALSFTDEDKIDFEKSWQISVIESIRLFNSLKCCPQFFMDQYQSIKHAQIMIKLLIQPILETIRNSLRNIILCQSNDKQCIIQLKARAISLPTWLCTNCPCRIKSMDNISIATHPLCHSYISDKCDKCLYTSSQYIPIFYKSDYQFIDPKGKRFMDETVKIKNFLLWGSTILSQFLLFTTGKYENLFLFWFDLFIKQEEYLCSTLSLNIINKQLHNQLINEKDKFLSNLQTIGHNDERIQLKTVYECFEQLLTYPDITEQMNAIKESQLKQIQNNECDVSSQYPQIKTFFSK